LRFKKSILWLVAVIASVILVSSCRSLLPAASNTAQTTAPTSQCEGSTPSENQTAPNPSPGPSPQYGEPTSPEGEQKDSNTEAYHLAVDGLVDNPLMLSYESIMHYPAVTDTVLLICPGVFADTREWTGVSLTTILTDAGIKTKAKRVMFYASDGYSTSLSLEEAQREGVFLAYKVNGQTLSKEDGYPLRLVAKGMDGSFWIRWVERIEIK
jgi:DMSO/TMAO reductase YedYZ molybdopterin-dependent catalytic subunit